MPRYPRFSFTVTARDPSSRARAGRLATPHGVIETPAFVFCATRGAIRAATPHQVAECGTQMVLANTYHLMLQPGAERLRALGGLHRFMAWDRPTMTDSGGFQIFSLAGGTTGPGAPGLIGITEDGAEFRSHIDGSRHVLTPERAIAVQRAIGADIVLALDDCTPPGSARDAAARSMALTHRWAARSLAAFAAEDDDAQALYGIVQGGEFAELRAESAGSASAQPFFGHAIGGVFGGADAGLGAVLAATVPHLALQRPIHLLGIGTIADIWEGVSQGIDTFDCVHPTRVARHGGALTRAEGAQARISLRNARFRDDPGPLEPDCPCTCCRHFSRAYLHHLLKAREILALQLLTLHNITVMNRLMEDIRGAIRGGGFAALRQRAYRAKQ